MSVCENWRGKTGNKGQDSGLLKDCKKKSSILRLDKEFVTCTWAWEQDRECRFIFNVNILVI